MEFRVVIEPPRLSKTINCYIGSVWIELIVAEN